MSGLMDFEGLLFNLFGLEIYMMLTGLCLFNYIDGMDLFTATFLFYFFHLVILPAAVTFNILIFLIV